MYELKFKPNYIVSFLGIIAICLILISTSLKLYSNYSGHGSIFGMIELFYVGDESNLPTLFSTVILLIAALLLGIIGYFEKLRKGRDKIYWNVLCLGFVYLAVDEIAVLHEQWTKPIYNITGEHNLGIFYFAWVIPGLLIAILLAFFFFKFLFRQTFQIRLNFIIAGSIYLLGAIGVEMIGGSYLEIKGVKDLTYVLIVTTEETLELTGIIWFIRALLIYMASEFGEIKLNFKLN